MGSLAICQHKTPRPQLASLVVASQYANTKPPALNSLRSSQGSEPGHLSYKKFLKAVMLGNTSKERVATIIEDLRWQFAR